jgi:uncharacterized protein (TIGR00290 family)
LALDRAVRQGLNVHVLFNIVDQATKRVRFHGVRADLIARQAEALGLELLQLATAPSGFEATFLQGIDALVERGVGGIIFGNIHLADVRAWYEERTTARGLAHVEPLWGESPPTLVRELLARGYRARITSIDMARAPTAWLGCELDTALLAQMLATTGLDAAGEHGEYHSFVSDGPLFRKPVPTVKGVVHQEEGHALVDLLAC